MKGLNVLASFFFVFPSLVVQAEQPPEMPTVTEWSGPFKETVIAKYYDRAEGVICYIYAPLNIGTSVSCGSNGCGTHFNGDIGSISCVKVTTNPKK